MPLHPGPMASHTVRGGSMTILGVQNILEILRCIRETERVIGRFYRRCAETWKADEAFWLNLEGEEIKHAQNIEEMAELIRRNPTHFQLNRPFSIAAISTVITGIEQNIDQLNRGVISRERAMVLARDIESSIIEKAYHEIVKTAELAYLTLVRRVVSETLSHKSAIENKIQESAAQPFPRK